jgi:hypothetical protein
MPKRETASKKKPSSKKKPASKKSGPLLDGEIEASEQRKVSRTAYHAKPGRAAGVLPFISWQ